MNRTKYFSIVFLGLLCLFVSGCVSAQTSSRSGLDQATAQTCRQTHELLNTVLWVQTSVEYQLAARQAYHQATSSLERALRDTSWTAALEQKDAIGTYEQLPPAVILDIDETVLDNTPFEARLIADKQEYDDNLWRDWVNEASAPAIPGAQEFILHALDKGVAVFFITNRIVDNKIKTVENLRRAISPTIRPDQVMCKREQPNWGSDKSSRRECVVQKYRVLLLIGDNYNDFVGLGRISAEQRIERGLAHAEFWSDKWIILPNSMYGAWEQALCNYDYSLSDADRLVLKYSQLRQKGIDSP
ncbi:hypothetical protein JXQ70_19795 [bacterium]|nr:hypothetical protein [bacterium]